jgi:hypothetical protein
MSEEIGDWITELRSSDLPAATNVGAALLAAMDAADVNDLAAVTQPAARCSRLAARRLQR